MLHLTSSLCSVYRSDCTPHEGMIPWRNHPTPCINLRIFSLYLVLGPFLVTDGIPDFTTPPVDPRFGPRRPLLPSPWIVCIVVDGAFSAQAIFIGRRLSISDLFVVRVSVSVFPPASFILFVFFDDSGTCCCCAIPHGIRFRHHLPRYFLWLPNPHLAVVACLAEWGLSRCIHKPFGIGGGAFPHNLQMLLVGVLVLP